MRILHSLFPSCCPSIGFKSIIVHPSLCPRGFSRIYLRAFIAYDRHCRATSRGLTDEEKHMTEDGQAAKPRARVPETAVLERLRKKSSEELLDCCCYTTPIILALARGEAGAIRSMIISCLLLWVVWLDPGPRLSLCSPERQHVSVETTPQVGL
jgi:hypothetical protein